jgi:hypothetical protein
LSDLRRYPDTVGGGRHPTLVQHVQHVQPEQAVSNANAADGVAVH